MTWRGGEERKGEKKDQKKTQEKQAVGEKENAENRGSFFPSFLALL